LSLPQLNIAQEIFTVFYAIFFGIMVQSTGWLHSFPTHESFALGLRSKATKRLFLSIITLNIIPLLYFLFFLNRLTFFNNLQLPRNLFDISYLKILCVITLTLPVFGFYRFHTGLMVGFWKHLYRPEHWSAIRNERVKKMQEKIVEGTVKINGRVKRKTTFDDSLSHVIPGLCYLPICIWLFLLVTLNVMGLLLDCLVFWLMILFWHLRRRNC